MSKTCITCREALKEPNCFTCKGWKPQLCSVPGCGNPATHIDPIDNDYICASHIKSFRSYGIKTEYCKI